METVIFYSKFRTPIILPYNRERAVQYAHNWAFKRNPKYFNFDNFGGDCTNFASQVLYEGSGIMNTTPVYGWYYFNSYNRSPSWAGVDYLYDFLIGNKGLGPFAEVVDFKDVQPGDIIQLAFYEETNFDHSPVVVDAGRSGNPSDILISAHTYDRDNYSLTNYNWVGIRCIHIIGVRK